MAEGRSRVARSRRKQQQAEEDQVRFVPPDWMRWKDCELCGTRFCVNNYADRQSRAKQTRKAHFGVLVCPWCLSRGGHENARRLQIVRRLAKDLPLSGELEDLADLAYRLKEMGKL